MIKKKLVALLAFTMYKSDCRTPQRIHRNEQKNKDNTMLYVIGGVAAVAIVGGAIWWFTKKDKKTTEDQQPAAEREFNEQDIDDILQLDTREEWLNSYESKMKSHSETIKKVIKELEEFPDNSNQQEQEKKYEEILNNNKFFKDAASAIYFFEIVGFKMVLMKEFLNKYKKDDRIKGHENLVEVFDQLLKLLPQQVKSNITYNASFQYFKQEESQRKLKETVQKEEDQLIEDRDTLQKISGKIKLDIINPINITDVVDQEGLNEICEIMKHHDVALLFQRIFNLSRSRNNYTTLLEKTIKNSSILQEVMKCQELMRQKLPKR